MATKHYINNKTFYEEMVKFKDAIKKAEKEGKEIPRIPNYIGECFMMICEKLATKPNFFSYSYKDEMISDAIENCVISVYSFDPDKSNNPFAYFTQIAWNAFIRRITREKKQAYIKAKNYERSSVLGEMLDDEGHTQHHSGNEYTDEIIRSFEEKLTKAPKKSKKRATT